MSFYFHIYILKLTHSRNKNKYFITGTCYTSHNFFHPILILCKYDIAVCLFKHIKWHKPIIQYNNISLFINSAFLWTLNLFVRFYIWPLESHYQNNIMLSLRNKDIPPSECSQHTSRLRLFHVKYMGIYTLCTKWLMISDGVETEIKIYTSSHKISLQY